MRFLLFPKIKPQMRRANVIYTHTHTYIHTHTHSSSVFKAIKKTLNFTERL